MSFDPTQGGYTQHSQRKAIGWFAMAEGAVCEGELLGRFQLKENRSDGSPAYYYQILLKSSCVAWSGSGKDREQVEGEPGEVVNVTQTASLESLYELCQDDLCAYQVALVIKGKIPLRGGKSLWEIDIFKKKLECKPETDGAPPQLTDDEGIPF